MVRFVVFAIVVMAFSMHSASAQQCLNRPLSGLKLALTFTLACVKESFVEECGTKDNFLVVLGPERRASRWVPPPPHLPLVSEEYEIQLFASP